MRLPASKAVRNMSMFTPDEPKREDFARVTDPRLAHLVDLPFVMQMIRDSPELFLDWETTDISTRNGGRPFMAGLYTPEMGAKLVDFRYLPEHGEAAVRDARRTAAPVTRNII